jgi:hypothetical protein
MGGKGGSGGVGVEGLEQMGYVLDPDYMGTGQGSYILKADYDKKYPKVEDPIVVPEVKKVEEPVVEEKKVVEEPVVEDVKPIGDPIPTGGAVDQPSGTGQKIDNDGLSGPDTTGDVLGGAVLKPPKYWVGNNYKRPSAGGGSLKISQT